MRIDQINTALTNMVAEFKGHVQVILGNKHELLPLDEIKKLDNLLEVYANVIFQSDQNKRILIRVKTLKLEVTRLLNSIRQNRPIEFRAIEASTKGNVQELDTLIDILETETVDLDRKIKFYQSVQYVLTTNRLETY